MRVIAGTQKGRRLHRPKGPGIRPTADRVKEALFSILGRRIVGARFLDLYAGTGAIGIEALSRGASHVTFVEANRSALRVLRGNLALCGLEATADIQACSAGAFLRRSMAGHPPYDILFADPPYRTDPGRELWPMLVDAAIAAPDALIVLEHASKPAAPAGHPRLNVLRQYRYGDTTLSVIGLAAQDAPAV
jgi:16S rRNA (guanine(966)-N(2))-methyltransferase RsmD